jgi:L-fucose mutarotase
MLKGIPPILSPELLKILMEMGHGDELVLADSNFPAAANAQRLVRCDGHGMPALLEAVLTLLPLDPYVESPVTLMAVVPGDTVETPIWDTYREIIVGMSPKQTELNTSTGSIFTTAPAGPLPSWPRASARCTRTSS